MVGPDNRILQDSRFAYTYDNEGNLVRKTEIATGNVTAFTYDFRNRLINVEERTASGIILHVTTYTYDVFDRRIAKTVDGNTTTTVYEGRQTWADFTGAGVLLARYLHGPRVDEMLARFRPAEGTSWYLTDSLGSVRDLINALGGVIDHIDYDSFGNVLLQTNIAAGDRYLFTGREFDSETGLYYYRGRYYDARLGRFISQDPLGIAAGDTNLYRYVSNDPLNATDPFGTTEVAEREVSRWSTAKAGSAIGFICGFVGGFTRKIIETRGDLTASLEYASLQAVIGAAVGFGIGLLLGPNPSAYVLWGAAAVGVGGLAALAGTGQLSGWDGFELGLNFLCAGGYAAYIRVI